MNIGIWFLMVTYRKPVKFRKKRSLMALLCFSSKSNSVENLYFWKGEGEGRRGNTCPQAPRFWKTPLDISRFGSSVNWQLVKREVERTDYPWIARLVKLLCSLIEHVPGDCKTVIKKVYDKRRLKLWAVAAKFLVFFYCVVLSRRETRQQWSVRNYSLRRL